MPLALLLKNLAGTLATAAKTLTPWIEIVALESIVVERARSAFLVHWFGFRLPFTGLNLRAVIVNTAELDQRFRTAQRSVPVSEGSPNLTAPLLGFAGTIAGMALSPVGAVAGIRMLWHFGDVSVGMLLEILVWFAMPAVLGFGLIVAPVGTSVLVVGGLGAAAAAFGLFAALGDRREVRGAYDVLGALARMFTAALVLIDQVRGPRADVRNPLLRRVLELADRMAALFAQALGTIAVLIVWVGPVLAPVARMLTGLGALASSVFAVLGETADALMENIAAMDTGRLSLRPVIAGVTAVVKRQLPIVQKAANAELELLSGVFDKVGERLGTVVDAFATAVTAFIAGLFTGHPAGRVVQALRTEIGLITALFALPAAPKPASTSGGGPSPIDLLLNALPDLPPVSFPSVPPLPDTKRLRRELGAANVPPLTGDSIRRFADETGPSSIDNPPIKLGTDAVKALEAAAKQPSIFRGERRPPAAALVANAEQLSQFRAAFSVVVGRVLPPELRGTGTEQLAKVFAAVDKGVYGAKERKVDADRLPVLDLPEDDRLQPVVPRLVLRTRGATLGEVRRFQARLTERLQAQSYRVGAAAPAGPGAP
jgi:hypothetical protein